MCRKNIEDFRMQKEATENLLMIAPMGGRNNLSKSQIKEYHRNIQKLMNSRSRQLEMNSNSNYLSHHQSNAGLGKGIKNFSGKKGHDYRLDGEDEGEDHTHTHTNSNSAGIKK